MPSDKDDPVSREEYEKFRKEVVNFLGILVQGFDKSVKAARNAQASIDNLAETVEDLAEMQKRESELARKNNRMLNDLHKKLLGDEEE